MREPSRPGPTLPWWRCFRTSGGKPRRRRGQSFSAAVEPPVSGGPVTERAGGRPSGGPRALELLFNLALACGKMFHNLLLAQADLR